MMSTSKLNKVLAELQERRAQHQENGLRLRHAAFTFRTGLSQIKHGIEQSAARPAELTGTGQTAGQEAMMADLQRRAS